MDNATTTVTIRYDRAGKLYYVQGFEFHRPRNWLAVEKGEDGKHQVYPFAFYEIKSGREEQVSPDDERVKLYADCEGWPKRGSAEWFGELHRLTEGTRKTRNEQRKTLEWYEKEVTRLDGLFAAAMEERRLAMKSGQADD